MNIKRQIAFVLVVIIGLVLMTSVIVIGSVNAQEGNQTQGNNETNSQVVTLGDDIEVNSYRFDTDNNTFIATVSPISGNTQRLELWDFYVNPDNGVTEPTIKTMLINEETEIRFKITPVDGIYGVLMESNGNYQLFTTEEGGFSFSEQYSGIQVIAFFAMGGLIGIIIVFGLAYRKKQKITTETERIL